jgi:Icc protein
MRFALISDVHFGEPTRHEGKLRKLTHQAEPLVAEFVARMQNEFQPELVVNLGDVLEDENRELDLARYARFVELVERAAPRTLHVAGNHDQVHLGDDDLRRLWRHDGPLHYSTDHGGCHFAVLRTIEHQDVVIRLPEEQIEWLAADLAATRLPSIVLMHHPASEMVLEGNRWFERRPHVCRVAERRKLRAVLEAAGNVIAVFNGHVHWNHCDFIGGIPYFTLQSLIENLDDDAPGRAAAAFAVCDLDAHRLVVNVYGAEAVRYQVELTQRT